MSATDPFGHLVSDHTGPEVIHPSAVALVKSAPVRSVERSYEPMMTMQTINIAAIERARAGV